MNTQYYPLFIVASLLIPNTVFACRCEAPGIDAAYKQSSMVVFANVQDVITAPSGEGSTAILKINRWWKSKSPEKITVNSLSNCSYSWKSGKNYLLFLNLESNGLYSTGLCAGNKTLKSSDAYEEKLFKLEQFEKDKE